MNFESPPNQKLSGGVFILFMIALQTLGVLESLQLPFYLYVPYGPSSSFLSVRTGGGEVSTPYTLTPRYIALTLITLTDIWKKNWGLFCNVEVQTSLLGGRGF